MFNNELTQLHYIGSYACSTKNDVRQVHLNMEHQLPPFRLIFHSNSITLFKNPI